MVELQNPVNWYEIPVNNLDRAQTFYEYVFNIEMKRMDFGNLQMVWFPMQENAPGATGALIKAESYIPSYEGTMVYFSVENINSVLKKIIEKGCKILNPKMSIGEFGYVAHFEDCEGNRIALHSKN
jgi:predicted enzyme related to lactoylglutathione lyase